MHPIKSNTHVMKKTKLHSIFSFNSKINIMKFLSFTLFLAFPIISSAQLTPPVKEDCSYLKEENESYGAGDTYTKWCDMQEKTAYVNCMCRYETANKNYTSQVEELQAKIQRAQEERNVYTNTKYAAREKGNTIWFAVQGDEDNLSTIKSNAIGHYRDAIRNITGEQIANQSIASYQRTLYGESRTDESSLINEKNEYLDLIKTIEDFRASKKISINSGNNEMDREKQLVEDNLRVEAQIYKNELEQQKREEKDAQEQERIDEMLSNPVMVRTTSSISNSNNSSYSSERQNLQNQYNNLLERQSLERKNSEAMGQALGNVVMDITTAIIEDSKRNDARKQAEAERNAILQKQANLEFKEELEAHNAYMQKRIDLLESDHYSLSNMLQTLEQGNIEQVYIILVNHNVETKRPNGATIQLPYKHLHVSYTEELIKIPVTDVFSLKYKKYIDEYNTFFVETIDTDKSVERKSYYFKTEREAKDFIDVIESMIKSRGEFVTWTTMTTENYTPIAFASSVGRYYQRDNVYVETNTEDQYEVYDATKDTDKEEITTTRSVLERYYRLLGSKEDYEKIKTSIIKFTMTTQGITLDAESKEIKPNFVSQSVFMNGVEVIKQVSDGTRGYQVLGGVKSDLPADEIKKLGSTSFLPETESDNIDGKAKKRTIEDGVKTFMVVNNGERQYYDRETGLLIKSISTIDDFKEDGDKTVYYYSDYRTIDGILMPFYMKTSYQDEDLIIQIKEVKFNPRIKKSDFKM